jgi:hypothetical protein
MAVHTKLTNQEIANFIEQNYQIGKLVSLKAESTQMNCHFL